MHKTSVAARAVVGLADQDRPQRGDFEIQADAIWVCCPGCGWASALLLGEPQGKHVRPARWKLSGTPEAPTLHPSIHHVGCWHGWLKAGQFTSC